MSILAIDHVQLAYPPGGEAEARRYYTDVMGFTEIPKPAAAGAGGLWFQAGPIELHLSAEPDFRASAKAHPAFVVDDLAAYRARCTTWRDANPIAGRARGHTVDPFGNRIELIAAAAAATAATA